MSVGHLHTGLSCVFHALSLPGICPVCTRVIPSCTSQHHLHLAPDWLASAVVVRLALVQIPADCLLYFACACERAFLCVHVSGAHGAVCLRCAICGPVHRYSPHDRWAAAFVAGLPDGARSGTPGVTSAGTRSNAYVDIYGQRRNAHGHSHGHMLVTNMRPHS